MFSEHLQLSSAEKLYKACGERFSCKKKKRKKNNGIRCECEFLRTGFWISHGCRFDFSSASPLRGNAPLMCFRMNIWPYCPSCCLLSQITFWHSSLLSESLRWLWPKASGGPNDKASLTISRQEHGSERGNWTVRERRGERRSAGEEGGAWGGGDKGGCDPILQNGARHNLFIWCTSESPFPRSHCSTDLPPSLAPLPIHLSPICLTFTRHNIPFFLKTVLYIWGNALSVPTCYYWHYSYYPHQVI